MTLPIRQDDCPGGPEGPAAAIAVIARAKARGNPFSYRPLRGRAVLRTAGGTDCHVASLLAMTIPSDLPEQSSDQVGAFFYSAFAAFLALLALRSAALRSMCIL